MLFDFDGVLVDSLYLHALSTVKSLEKNTGISLNLKQRTEIMRIVKSNIGKPFDEILATIENMLDITIECVEDIKIVKRSLFLRNLDLVEVLPCVYGTLEYLKKYLTIGVASFASKLTLLETLRSKKLERYFEVILSIDDVPFLYQEKKKLYQLSVRMLEYTPCEGILVGDTPIDIKAGKEIGLLTVGVCTGIYKKNDLHESGAHRVFNTLCEFSSWVKKSIRFTG